MGQYYLPISLEKKECVCSHDYDNGLKLMEHSYIGNNFVNVIEKLLAAGGAWFGDRIVWAGDYADPEIDENGDPLTYVEDGQTYEQTLYNMYRNNEIKPEVTKLVKFRYMVNHTKKEFVDLNLVPVCDEGDWTDKKGKVHHYKMKIHPLPLLTCEGCGRGGGDYRSENELIGKWARDVVEPMKRKPSKEYTRIDFNLTED